MRQVSSEFDIVVVAKTYGSHSSTSRLVTTCPCAIESVRAMTPLCALMMTRVAGWTSTSSASLALEPHAMSTTAGC